MVSRTGRARATSAGSPPTKMCRSPSRAFNASATGASRNAMLRRAAASAMRRPSTGELVLMSIASAPSGSAASAPPEPSRTSSTCGGAGSMVTSTSAVAAQSAAEAAGAAPIATAASTASRRRSNALTSKPARATRSHIGPPMCPSPMKPTLMRLLRVAELLEVLAGDRRGLLLVEVDARVQLLHHLRRQVLLHLSDDLRQVRPRALGRLVVDHQRDVVGREELLVVLEYEEVVGGDLPVGGEHDRDVGLAAGEHLVAVRQLRRDVALEAQAVDLLQAQL